MGYLFLFSRKNIFYLLNNFVGVKWHFPLLAEVFIQYIICNNETEVFIQSIIDYKVSLAKSLASNCSPYGRPFVIF